MTAGAPMLSVIVPVYNEEAALPAFLAMASAWCGTFELVFSDGGSVDRTKELVTAAGYRLVEGPKGRGGQCARGVAAASGDAVMFMHADESVGPDAVGHAARALARGVEWGCLTLRWTKRTPTYLFGELLSNLRVRVEGIPFADQCPFMSRSLYDEAGGMPDIPIMEDYELALRLRSRGLRPTQLPDPVWASPRRFEQGGPLRVALMMRRLRRLYRRGVSPDELNAMYRDVR